MLNKVSKVLITGAAGFIGSHLAERLCSKEIKVIGLDDLSGGLLANLSSLEENNNFKFIEGDMLNLNKSMEIPGDLDAIFHFGAQSSVSRSTKKPGEEFDANTKGTFEVLEYARKKGVESVIFASSSTVYGNAKLPTREEHSIKPISNYGASKASSEAYCFSYSSLYGMKNVNLRFYNIYGPRSRKGVMYDLVQKLEKNEQELEILGTGEQTKDYLYIDDTIEAIELILNEGELEGEAYNIGFGENHSVREIARKICEILGVDPKISYTEGISWKGDVEETLADISKLTDLGFEPKIDIEEGLRRLIDWILDVDNTSFT